MEKLIFATNNPNKLKEVREMLGGKFQILSLNEINCFDEIEETADTFEGNALIKARFVYEKFGYNCFSDDSGLEVDFLNGAPGVFSARYAGEGKDMEANMQKLLLELKEATTRKAQFRTSVALILNGEEYFFDGIIRGTILTEKRGEKGFGYDPLFVPEGYIKTFAEMTPEEKHAISHRGIAIAKLTQFLQSKI